MEELNHTSKLSTETAVNSSQLVTADDVTAQMKTAVSSAAPVRSDTSLITSWELNNTTGTTSNDVMTSIAGGYSWLAGSRYTDWLTPAASSPSSPPSPLSSRLPSSSSSSSSPIWDAKTTARYHVEDEFTGLHNILSRDRDGGGGDDEGEDSRDVIIAVLVTIIVLAIVCNLIVCIVVRIDRRLHQMTYYFFVSMASLHIVMATILMPPALLIVTTGTFNYPEELCKLWITMDFFFCNSTSLHLAFVNMDTFLRLKDPLRHGRVSTTCSLVLWLGAPWAISSVQAVAQFMLSQEDEGTIRDGSICFINDKNFIILGVMFSFLIPTIISVIFYVLCVHELRLLRAGKLLDDSESSNPAGYGYGSNESIADADDDDDGGGCSSDTTSYLSDGGIDVDGGRLTSHGGGGGGVVHERVQLAVVTNLKASTELASASASQFAAAKPDASEETTSFCDDTIVVPTDDHHTKDLHCYGHSNVTFQYTEQPTGAVGGEHSSCTLLLRDPAAVLAVADGRHVSAVGADDQTTNLCSEADYDHCSPDEVLRRELAISRLMFLLLLFSITLWVPYSASNVVYGTCDHCRRHMTFTEVMTFRWLAYSSAVVGPWIYVRFSEPLRQAIWSMLTCRYCKWQQ